MIYNTGWGNLKPQKLKYTPALAAKAAKLLQSGESLTATARSLRISRASLRNWRDRDPALNNAFTTFEANKAKAVNFGLLYGQAPNGLVRYAKSSFGVDLTFDEPVDLHKKFFDTYKGLAEWYEQAREKAGGKVDEVRTLTGRRKLLPPKSEDTFWSRFSAGFLNMVVQGTCADGLKQAMVQLADKLPKNAQMIGTVHDELIVECPTKTAKKVCQLTEDTMREAMTEILKGDMPVEVDAKVCKCWQEK